MRKLGLLDKIKELGYEEGTVVYLPEFNVKGVISRFSTQVHPETLEPFLTAFVEVPIEAWEEMMNKPFYYTDGKLTSCKWNEFPLEYLEVVKTQLKTVVNQ